MRKLKKTLSADRFVTLLLSTISFLAKWMQFKYLFKFKSVMMLAFPLIICKENHKYYPQFFLVFIIPKNRTFMLLRQKYLQKKLSLLSNQYLMTRARRKLNIDKFPPQANICWKNTSNYLSS